MSRPRPIVPGRTYMVTRRCRDRRFLLRPDKATTEAFHYCLALGAQRFNMGVVGFVANSNHHHTVVVDRDGRLPEFLHFFHAMLAKHQNCLRGRWENHWATEQTSVVQLIGREDVLSKLVYALTNPVKDNLVEKAHHWPGANAIHQLRGNGYIQAVRPRRFFNNDGLLPESVSLKICCIPGFESDTEETYLARINAAVTAKEDECARKRCENRTGIMGRKSVLRQHWDSRPKSNEPRRQMSPTVASINKWRRIERLQHNKQFLAEYRDAWKRWSAGEVGVVFPEGTYWLRRFAAVQCADGAN